MELDEKISENFKSLIKKKYKTVSECARKNGASPYYLNNTIGKIKKGIYPSIPKIKEFAEMCECDFTDFFKIEEQ